MSIRNLFYTMLTLPVLFACSEPTDYSDPKDSVAPGKVTVLDVININGGAKIAYIPPADEDLLGVKAVYQKGGQQLERYASHWKDTITLEGFGDTNKYQVTLYAIDNSKNTGEGESTEIQPLPPPIEIVGNSLRLKAAYGGLKLEWNNEEKREYAVTLYVADKNDDMKPYDTYFSAAREGAFIFRPMTPTPTHVQIELRDKWYNRVTVLDTLITPLFEEEIAGRDKDGRDIWSQYGLNDNSFYYRGDCSWNNMNVLWDDLIKPNHGFQSNGFATGTPAKDEWPFYFTIDMGKKAVYYRMNFTTHLFPETERPRFNEPFPSDFEIWGCNDPKPLIPNSVLQNQLYWTGWESINGFDMWKNDWTLLSHNRYATTSGATRYSVGMYLSEEDLERATTEKGFDFDMTEEVQLPFRYLRFVVYDTFTGDLGTVLVQLRFWGKYAEDE